MDAEESAAAARTYTRLLGKAGLASVASLIDVGAGDGAFLSLMASVAREARVAVEPNAQSAEIARRRGLRVVAALDDLGESESFDLGVILMTLEHVSDPERTLRQITSRVRDGGAIAVAHHDSRSVINRMLRSRSPIMDVEHRQIFSVQGLQDLLRRLGVRQTETHRYVNIYPLGYLVRLLPIGLSIRRRVATMTHHWMARVPVPVPAGNCLTWGRVSRPA
jgi:SAM-dependent methyltransferase